MWSSSKPTNNLPINITNWLHGSLLWDKLPAHLTECQGRKGGLIGGLDDRGAPGRKGRRHFPR